MTDKYLMHHGRKGMKWGQHIFGEKTSTRSDVDHSNSHPGLKKGTKLYRVTPNKKDSEAGPTYMTYKKADRNFYRYGYKPTIMRREIEKGNRSAVYETEYKAIKDMKIASYKEADAVMRKGMKDKAIAKEIYDVMKTEKIRTSLKISYDQAKKAIESDPTVKRAADRYIKSVKQNSFDDVYSYNMRYAVGGSPKMKAYLAKELGKKGYDGMTDMGGVGNRVHREGIDPLIVFNPSSSTSTKRSKNITYRFDPLRLYSPVDRAQLAEMRYKRLSRKGQKTNRGDEF